MKLNSADLKAIADRSRELYLLNDPSKDPNGFTAKCWINALQDILYSQGFELYAFEKDYNKDRNPKLMIDISGKLEV